MKVSLDWSLKNDTPTCLRVFLIWLDVVLFYHRKNSAIIYSVFCGLPAFLALLSMQIDYFFLKMDHIVDFTTCDVFAISLIGSFCM